MEQDIEKRDLLNLSLSNDLQKTKDQVEQLSSNLRERDEEIESFRESSVELNGTIEKMKASITEFESRINQLNGDKTSLEKTNEQLTEQLSSLNNERSLLQRDIEEKETEIRNLTTENKGNLSKIRQFEEKELERKKQNENLDALLEQIKLLESEKLRIEQDLQNLRNKEGVQQQKVQSLKRKIEENELLLGEHLEKLRVTENALKGNLEQLRERFTKEGGELKTKNADLTQLYGKVSHLLEELLKGGPEYDKLIQSIENLQKAIPVSIQKIRNKEPSLVKLETLKQEIQTLKDQQSQIDKEVKNQEQVKEELEGQLQILTEKRDSNDDVSKLLDSSLNNIQLIRSKIEYPQVIGHENHGGMITLQEGLEKLTQSYKEHKVLIPGASDLVRVYEDLVYTNVIRQLIRHLLNVLLFFHFYKQHQSLLLSTTKKDIEYMSLLNKSSPVHISNDFITKIPEEREKCLEYMSFLKQQLSLTTSTPGDQRRKRNNDDDPSVRRNISRKQQSDQIVEICEYLQELVRDWGILRSFSVDFLRKIHQTVSKELKTIVLPAKIPLSFKEGRFRNDYLRNLKKRIYESAHATKPSDEFFNLGSFILNKLYKHLKFNPWKEIQDLCRAYALDHTQFVSDLLRVDDGESSATKDDDGLSEPRLELSLFYGALPEKMKLKFCNQMGFSKEFLESNARSFNAIQSFFKPNGTRVWNLDDMMRYLLTKESIRENYDSKDPWSFRERYLLTFYAENIAPLIPKE